MARNRSRKDREKVNPDRESLFSKNNPLDKRVKSIAKTINNPESER